MLDNAQINFPSDDPCLDHIEIEFEFLDVSLLHFDMIFQHITERHVIFGQSAGR